MDIEDRFTEVTRTEMIPKRGAYGKRGDGGALARMSKAPVEVHHYDEVTEETRIETVQEVGPILDALMEYRQTGQDGYTPSRDMRWVGSVPLAMVDQLHRAGIDITKRENLPYLMAMLDDPEYGKLRTGGGKLSRKPKREFVTAKTRSRKN